MSEIDDKHIPQRGTPQFPISQPDLEELERVLPELYGVAMDRFTQPRHRKQWDRVKTILSNVRWHYCPATEVHIIPVDGANDNESGPDEGELQT